MKKLLFIFLFIPFLSFAQVNDYFLNNPQWNVFTGNGFAFPCIEYDSVHYSVNGDSIINSMTYKKLYRHGYKWYSWQSPNPNPGCFGSFTYTNTDPEGFLRSLNGQMFWIPYGDTAEYLLYDFNLTVGSLVPQTFLYTYSNTYVTAVDSFYTPYGYRKIFTIDNDQTDLLIEGVGSSYGLIQPFGIMLDVVNNLICYGLNDTAYYPMMGPACDVITGVQQPEMITAEIYPNPASSSVFITADMQGTLELVDVLGNVVYSSAFVQRAEIDVTDLSSGIYFVRISDAYHQITSRFVVE